MADDDMVARVVLRLDVDRRRLDRRGVHGLGGQMLVGVVCDYIATGGFASRCDAISRVVDTMMATLTKEKRYYEHQGEAVLRAEVEGMGAAHRGRDREPLRHRR